VARRKELKSIASGVYGSFISRNNDVAGYWGIGKLCLLARERCTTIVRLDLLEESIVPEGSEFAKLVAGYEAKLKAHLAARKIPEGWVTSAIIELDFKPEYPVGKQIPIRTWGNLFKLTVRICDDKQRRHEVHGYSYSAPHDQTRESRSGGKERF
jgi:hypothetical protein